MNNDELFQLQKERWQELLRGQGYLKGLVEDLYAGYGAASSKVSEQLKEIEELAFNLRSVADQITKTAWRDYE